MARRAPRPRPEPRLFAAFPGQRPAERRVAIRVLGELASPEALRVLAGYARDDYPGTDLDELHRAWGRFDRREFAKTMFDVADKIMLRLGDCGSVEGIGAATGLRGLDVTFDAVADLTPLAECTDLEWLELHVTEGVDGHGREPLQELPALRELKLIGRTRDVDLSPLAQTPVRGLHIELRGADGAFLTRLTQLRVLELSGGRDPEDNPWSRPDDERQPARPELGDVVIRLVTSGVMVKVPRYEKHWVDPLAAALPDGIVAEERHHHLVLTRAE